MRKFRFRLRPVLERAQRREQQRQLELAHLQTELAANQDLLEILREARAVWLCQLLEYEQRSFEIDEVRRRRAHLDSLAEAIDEQCTVVSDLGRQVEEAQAAVLAAMRERQMLENLRDRQQTAHLQAAHRLEADLLVADRQPRIQPATPQQIEAGPPPSEATADDRPPPAPTSPSLPRTPAGESERAVAVPREVVVETTADRMTARPPDAPPGAPEPRGTEARPPARSPTPNGAVEIEDVVAATDRPPTLRPTARVPAAPSANKGHGRR